MAEIHDRMPAILRPEDYDRWLGVEPDPRDLLGPFPAQQMRMWPVSSRVNSPKNDDAGLLEPVQERADAVAVASCSPRTRMPLRTRRSFSRATRSES